MTFQVGDTIIQHADLRGSIDQYLVIDINPNVEYTVLVINDFDRIEKLQYAWAEAYCVSHKARGH